MIDLLVDRLEKCGYRRIGVSYKEISLFYTVSQGICYLVNVIDYRDAGTSPLSKEFLAELNKSLCEFLAKKGLYNPKILAVVTTYSEYVAEDLIDGLMAYWVLDVYHNELVIPQNQPENFLGLRTEIEDLIGKRHNIGDVNIRIRKGSYKNRIINFNNLMVLINVLVFFILESMGSTESSYFMLKHGAFYWPAISEDGELYRFITCMFLHFGFSHLFNNMIVLYFLGDNLERAIGGKKYLTIYLGTGLVATFVSCAYYLFVDEQVLSCGASGAIFGVIGALVYIVWKNNGRLEDLNVYRLLLFVGFSFYSGFTSTGVDNAAHVGGFMAGVFLAMLLYKFPDKKNNHISGD